jgi:membrane carboxypeptidase/penicillin-binding protein PbpC
MILFAFYGNYEVDYLNLAFTGVFMSGYPYNQRHYRRFRNILIDLNRDLLTISEYMNEYDDYYELNDLCYFVMALEDRRFFRHCGFDFFSFVREVFKAACKETWWRQHY